MDMPVNVFKQSLRSGRQQLGLWVGLADSYVAELLATTGFDWLLIDAEHSPNDPRSVLAQLQAIAAYRVQPIVRPVCGNVEIIKQYLDLGVQTILVPMVETAEQAATIVAATRYPTRGVRGVGSALTRSSRWNQVENYLQRADEEMCVVVQIESVKALTNLAAIVAVDGVDGIFFGPADLSASMGLLGKPGDASVQAAMAEGIAIAKRAGKAAGTLTSDETLARQYVAMGATFIAAGVDTALLVRAATQLRASFSALVERPPSSE
jgi:4-hydroxy-2-oxoheptanedioate aldolase